MPNDAAVHLDFAFLRRWQRQYDEAAALFVRAAELDPRSWTPLQAATLLTALGRRDQAQLVVRAAQAAAPDDALAATLPVVLALMYDCDLAEAERVNTAAEVLFPDHPAPFAGRWWLAWLSGDAASAVAALDEFTARFSEPGPYLQTWENGHTQLAAGRVDEGQKTLRDALEAALAILDQQNQTYARIGIYQALLGQRAQAVESAERSRHALRSTGAVWSRTGLLFEHAIALAQVGETEAAIDRLREMPARPAEFGASGLWCYPLLRPLRADPRFRDLIADHGGNVAIDPYERSTWP